MATTNGTIVAWIEKREDEIEAAFVAADIERQPARSTFSDMDEARRWVEAEARAIGANIQWRE